MLGSRHGVSRQGGFKPPRTAVVIDDEDELYKGFNEVSPALDTKTLREDQVFQQTMRTANVGRQAASRMGTGMFRVGTVSVRGARTGSARPVTALRAAGYSSGKDAPRDERKEDTIEDKVKQMEAKIMILVEESCVLVARRDTDDENDSTREQNLSQALAKAQEASTLERQLIRMQEQANLGDTHNLDLTFAVLCNLADQYALNEMYTEALNTYQLLTRNKLFPHANRLKVNMGNIHFKMGEHPKALKLYRMALDQTPTAEKDLRMKVMHNIGLLLVRMGKFRDAVTNFQHIMQEQGDFQTGLHLVLCSVALDDAEGGKAAFHAMLDVEPPTYHHDIAIDDENDPYECVVRDVVRGDRLSRWSRAASALAERCLALAAAALARDEDAGGTSWCVEALRGYSGGSAGARLELGSALAALRSAAGTASTGAGSGSTGAMAAGTRALQRLKAVARAHPNDRVLRAEANADAAFVAYALGKYSEARTLSEAASRDDPYGCAARVTHALSAMAPASPAPGGVRPPSTASDPVVLAEATASLSAATHLDPTDLIALHDSALALEMAGEEKSAEARWQRIRSAATAGGTLRGLAAAGLARLARNRGDASAAEHWYGVIGSWDASVTLALAELHAEAGDPQTAQHHYQHVEAAWPGEEAALRWLARGPPSSSLPYLRRAARLQPGHPEWGLLMGECLRANGQYQEALTVYKKLNARFPDNVECLKLLVKLCGAQGLEEAAVWRRQLRGVLARAQGETRGLSAASASSAEDRGRAATDAVGDAGSETRGGRASAERAPGRAGGAGRRTEEEELPLPPE
ncbi:intraflagellar transport protein 88 homolog [Danaus plexippus]|uniref:intraflagellar transport protein 88 homolog n=1 Tax=Danaus plexippus TaxID=13037 RepID=UPI002AB307AB|nr:intraflagellar transport protein 88 homolog [Danaus plexippus]XP_061378742.1 intraflagellar transport protein 88 homolog [Danaus plexippus]